MNMREDELLELIQHGENLSVEFKSDQKKLPDSELVAAVVALANTNGGDLLVGVEDDGAVTGLHHVHQDMSRLAAFIANRTNPPLSVSVEKVTIGEVAVAHIRVPQSRWLVSTSEGLLQRRRLMADGKPEAVPFYPHEFIQRQSGLGLVDPSAMPLTEVSLTELDPLQRLRIRNAIKKYGGDQSLIPLADEELDGALGLVAEVKGQRCPTLAGLLLLGNEALLRRHLPAYEVAFQVLQGTNVQVNEFFRKPLLETFEEVELLFRARVIEEEIQIGLFRVPIPNYDRRAFREAFVNALVHRDFSRLGAVHVRLDDAGLAISSPGGFIEGVTLDNLLVVSPRSRNPLLADIIKRIGLAERTGRGIDRIFEGMLRYGRPAPDYSLSDATTVTVVMINTKVDVAFLKMVVEQEDHLGEMPIDSLIILSRLREGRRLSTADFLSSVQKPEPQVRATLERLAEAGLVEPHGSGRGRSYTLSAKLYCQTGKRADYIRQAGFSDIQEEQMVLRFIDKNGAIKRADVMELCHLSKDQAAKLLKRLSKEDQIEMRGHRRGAYYVRKG
jgi:ATP-dependent DNA helicase RecG